MDITRVVLFSGGVGSWAAAKRVVARHGLDGLVLVFADTKAEDADLYRFLRDAATDIGAPLLMLADGRTPWEVFKDVRMIGNALFDPCSRILKREVLDAWKEKHCDRERTTFYVGLDWTEGHRMNGRPRTGLTKAKLGLKELMRLDGWRYEAPLCERPLISKSQMLTDCVAAGIEPPQLYKEGFPHNNCAGACVKAGHAQWAHLLKVRPDTYAEQEALEASVMADIGGEWGILRDRRGGKAKPMTLRDFRLRIESGGYTPKELEGFEWGGCGCAIEYEETAL